MSGDSLMNDIMQGGGGSEEQSAVGILFDTKNYARLKMTSEIPPSMMYVSTILGVLQKRYHSKVLKDFDVELLSRQKSRDRKGVIELVEILLGMRRAEGGDDGE